MRDNFNFNEIHNHYSQSGEDPESYRYSDPPSVCVRVISVGEGKLVGSISATLSSPVFVPPRSLFGGGARAHFPSSGW